MELRLDDRVAVVTGASKGIGLAIATTFAGAGAEVLVSSRKQHAVKAAAAAIRSRHPDADVAPIAANAGEPEQAAGCVASALELAAELPPAVRVNAVAPGLVRTDFARALWEADEEGMAASMPLGRLGEPGDVATAALFLCSDAASWITGEVLVVDGGCCWARRERSMAPAQTVG